MAEDWKRDYMTEALRERQKETAVREDHDSLKNLITDDKVTAILDERKKTHGDYSDHARVTQALKRVMEIERGWQRLNDCQREALAIIAHKIGRILVGNPDHHDHWDDIAGYARLVSERIPK